MAVEENDPSGPAYRGPAKLRPTSRTALQDGATGSQGPDVARPAPPDAGERVRRAARNARPGAAVPVHDGAGIVEKPAHRPDAVRPTPPDAQEGVRRAAQDARPRVSIPAADGPPAPHGPDVARPAPPDV